MNTGGTGLNGVSKGLADGSYAPLGKRIYLDNYAGADATGVTLSDAAWNAAYADAVAHLAQISSGGAHNGATIIGGPGIYKFSVDVLRILDKRIGFLGAGKQATTIWTDQGGGKLLYAVEQDPTGNTAQQTAPIDGFTLFGWQAGAASIGMHLGCRPGTRMKDVAVVGFRGAGSIGVLFRNDNDAVGSGSGMEGSDIAIDLSQNGSNDVLFDGSVLVGGVLTPDIGTFDYGRWFFHSVTKTFNQNARMVKFQNGAHMFGGNLQIVGNISANDAAYTAAVLEVGTGGAAKLLNSSVHIAVECDNSTGTVYDWLLSGDSSSGNRGIVDCTGLFKFLNAGGTFTRGTVTNSRLRVFGVIDGPSVTTATPNFAWTKRGGVCTYLDSGSTVGSGIVQESHFGQNLTAGGVTAAIGSAVNGMSVTVNGNTRTGVVTIVTASVVPGDFTSGLTVANLTMPTALSAGNNRLAGLTPLDAVSAKVLPYGSFSSSTLATIGFAVAPAPSTTYRYAYEIVGQN